MIINSIIEKLNNIYNKKDYRSNVIYITTICNYKCEYCLVFSDSKKIKRTDHKTCSEYDIDKFIEDVYYREFDNNGRSITIMGGEPLLVFDKVKYLFNKTKEMFYDTNQTTNIIIFTNGSFFGNKNNIIKFKNEVKYYKQFNINILLAVSFDGSGQKERIKKDNYIETILEDLFNNNINFHISYTINKSNYYNWKDDLKLLINKFNKKIHINITHKILEETFSDFNIDILKKEINNFNKNNIILDVDKNVYKNRTYQLPDANIINYQLNKRFVFDNIYDV